MKPLALLALFLLTSTTVSLCQEITLRTDVTFTRDDGSQFTIRKGTTLNYTRTEKLYYIIHSEDEGDLAISESVAAEYHQAFAAPGVEQRFVEIAVELRSQEIVPTNARVLAILRRELRENETNRRLGDIERSLDELRQTRRH
jgi:hypothetical protein